MPKDCQADKENPRPNSMLKRIYSGFKQMRYKRYK